MLNRRASIKMNMLVFTLLVSVCSARAQHISANQVDVSGKINANDGKFSGNFTATAGQNSLVLYNLNGQQLLDGNHYDCSGVGLASAVTALSSGGTIDASGCNGTISPTSTVTLNVNNLKLVFGSQTWSFPRGVSPGFSIRGNGVVVECKGQQSVITSAALGTESPSSPTYLFMVSGVGDELRGCNIQGQTTSGANNFQIGVYVNGARAKVVDNYFAGTTGSTGLNTAVDVCADGAFVERNYITQINSPPDGTGFGVITICRTSGGSIRGNHVVFNPRDGTGAHQIYVTQGASNYVISDNILEGGVGNQIKLASTDTQPPTCYNDIHDNVLVGLSPGAATGALYLSNYTPSNKIHDNLIISPPTSPGIELDGNTNIHTPDGNSVSNNTVISPGQQCILLHSANNTLVGFNDCRSPSRREPGKYEGFRVDGDGAYNGAANNIFVGNSISGTGFRASIVIGSVAPLPSGTIVYGNNFPSGGGFQAIDGGNSSIYGLNLLNGQPALAQSLYFGGVSANGAASPTLYASTTAPIISSGFGSSPSIVANNGTAAFEIDVGAGTTARMGVIGMPAAKNGWVCHVTDLTSDIAIRETAFSRTSVTLTAASAWATGDRLLVSCGGF